MPTAEQLPIDTTKSNPYREVNQTMTKYVLYSDTQIGAISYSGNRTADA